MTKVDNGFFYRIFNGFFHQFFKSANFSSASLSTMRSRRKNGEFSRKIKPEMIQTLLNSLLVLATIAVAA